MIHLLVSLGTLPLSLLAVSASLIGSVISGLTGLGSLLISAPVLIPAMSMSLLPALGLGTIFAILEEHPEIVGIGALCLGVILALFLLLHNGLNGNRINGSHINGHGFNGGKNGLNGIINTTRRNGINGRANGRVNGAQKNKPNKTEVLNKNLKKS
ncbi:MAG: hypothetical protein QW122_04320 [Archaeoglobaceae archaeon]